MAKPLVITLNLLLAVLVSSLGSLTPVRAHEVQPTVMDVLITSKQIEITAEWMIEAAVAGLDLAAVTDTSEAENDAQYDLLRQLDSDKMEEAIRAAWPGIAAKVSLTSGRARLEPELAAISIPPVGNIELPRLSTLRMIAALPEGEAPITIGWNPELGPLVVRQIGVENGYAAFLSPGMISDPIPRQGATEQNALEAFTDYIRVGFDHIVPQGLDHILFVLGLFFLSLHIRPLLWQVTAFTLAHTVTLALGALDIIRLPAEIVEPLIAASIVYVGVENLILRRMAPWRPVVVFCFGLLHGLGFAAVLQDFGLGADNFIPKLIGFNVGVEFGQLAVIAAGWVSLAVLFGRYDWYHRRIGAPVSAAIAVVAAFWVLERTGLIGEGGAWALFSALTEGGFMPLVVAVCAVLAGSFVSIAVMTISTSDMLRDVAGMLTSLVMFLAVVATFTSGAWIMSVLLAATWIICLRLQSLGGP